MSIKDTVVLKNGKWEAGVCARLGGNAIYLRYDGKDILCPLVDEAQIEVNPYLQGDPILLPANRIYLGKFSFEGVDYTLPITEPRTFSHLHGTVHRQPFEILAVSDTSITMKYVNKDRYEVYPFDFEMVVTYTIDEEGFTQQYDIKNIDNKNMPYTFCLHTTFVEPTDGFTLPIVKRQEHDPLDIPTGRYVELTEQEKKYTVWSPSKGVQVVGYYESCGHVARVDDIVYTVSDNFDYWIMYNGEGVSGFLCIEPQAGKVDGLNIPDGHKVLAPNETVTYSMRFTHA